MSPSKPKLRKPPELSLLVERQEATERLLKLDDWTQEPNNPAPVAPGKAPKSPQAPRVPPAVVKPPEPPKKPWELPSVDATHPYHIVLTERLFLKMDFVWKRKGYKSAREFVLQTLEATCEKALKDMGELK